MAKRAYKNQSADPNLAAADAEGFGFTPPYIEGAPKPQMRTPKCPAMLPGGKMNPEWFVEQRDIWLSINSQWFNYYGQMWPALKENLDLIYKMAQQHGLDLKEYMPETLSIAEIKEKDDLFGRTSEEVDRLIEQIENSHAEGMRAIDDAKKKSWIKTLRKLSKVQRWCREKVPYRKYRSEKEREVWEHLHPLRFAIYCARSDLLSPTGEPKVIEAPPHFVKASLFMSLARKYRASHNIKGVVIVIPPGHGKCLGKGTPVLMFNGDIKPVEDIVEGDLLMGPDSRPRRVLSTCRGREEMFRITPAKGDSYVVNRSHILSLRMNAGDCAGYEQGQIVNISVDEYLNKGPYFKQRAKGWRTGVDWSEKEVPIDPYVFGCWLGDGHSSESSFTSMDGEVVSAFREYADGIGCSLRFAAQTGSAATYRVTTGRKLPRVNKMTNALKDIGVWGKKSIPQSYLTNSRRIRLELLAGLIDTDGYVNKPSTYEIITKSADLERDILFLARSLGFAAYSTPCEKSCQTGAVGIYYRISIAGSTDSIPVRIHRKSVPARRQIKNVLNVGLEVESIGEGDYYGFTIDGDHLFLLGDFTVTHNTTIAVLETALNICLNPHAPGAVVHAKEEIAQHRLESVADLFDDAKPEGKRRRAIFPEITLDPSKKGKTASKMFVHKNGKRVIRYQEGNLGAYGMHAVAGGLSFYNVLFDDVIDEKVRDEVGTRERCSHAFNRTWLKRLRGSNAFFVFVTTRWHPQDLVGEIQRLIRLGVLNVAYYTEACGGPEQDFKPVWSDAWNRIALKAEWHRGPAEYACIFQNDPDTEESRRIGKLCFYDWDIWRKPDMRSSEWREFFDSGDTKYTLDLDPSGTGKRTSNKAGMLYSAFGNRRVGGKFIPTLVFLRYWSIYAGQHKLAEEAAMFGKKNRVDEYCVETTGGYHATAEELTKSWDIPRHQVISLPVPISEGTKVARFMKYAAHFENGDVLFPGELQGEKMALHPEWEDAAEQILRAGNTRDDNILDVMRQRIAAVAHLINRFKGVDEPEEKERSWPAQLDTFWRSATNPKEKPKRRHMFMTTGRRIVGMN